MTKEELREMMPVVQAYVDDEKREVINEELEDKADEQPCVTIDDIIEQIEVAKKEIGNSATKQ